MPFTSTRADDDVALRAIMLAMVGERSLDDLLRMITSQLAVLPNVALARIWLIDRGDICERCPAAKWCPGHIPCLHLVASAGRPNIAPHDWSRLDGPFARRPIGLYRVGTVAKENQGITIPDVRVDPREAVLTEWFAEEGIVGFAGKPLTVRGEVVGVLAVVTRNRFDQDMCEMTGVFANHAAMSIANARAFAEVDRLHRALAAENDQLRAELSAQGAFGDIIGSSPAIGAVTARIALVAPTPTAVLITGESGTGKELVAREIHRRSDRADGPLVRVNCAAIPDALFESEFFGHTKGAFTGAVADRIGRFAAADGGTLLLDEVGEIPLALQGKLLRVLQEGTYERVGEERVRRVDVRIIAATNRDPAADVAAGRFRADLYYRLNVVPIHVPPLRERREDIPAIAQHLLAGLAIRHRRPVPKLSRADLQRLEAHPWPGNVRELANVLERGLIIGQGGRLVIDLPAAAAPAASPAPISATDIISETEMEALTRRNLMAALKRANGQVFGPGGAAELLGVKPTTLVSRLKRYRLR